ncbi:hypothetical protein SLEP1_g24415 [Rubroshorea leprosula]|uniref:Uncharacterized protein n=1 Tax=Rubroshorea leprosula TaxID=152421 RepID=A0AAV5JIR2_9ROSI|nr:hypothetical protein SLEP1_g24415 [Rubroshorea leprosula]
MSGRPINSARSRTTSRRRGHHDAVDLAHDVTPIMNARHTQSISPQGSVHVAAASFSQKQKGRGPNKLKKAARRPYERPFIQISHKGTFLDVEVPRLITTLWKRVYDGDYFTYELFPEHKKVQVWELFKTHYQWAIEDEDAVRKAFLRSMKKGWDDNMKDEWDKWHTNGEYRSVWVLEHLWPILCTYWDSDEFHILSERGRKTEHLGSEFHTLHDQIRMSVSALLFMARTQHHGHHETMTFGQLLLVYAITISCRELVHSAYGMRPPRATPSLPHTKQAFPPVGTSFPTVGPSFHANGPSFPHAMPMQLPIEPAFPMGQMGKQSEAPNTSSPNPPQDEFGYQPRFDADYQGPFGPE